MLPKATMKLSCFADEISPLIFEQLGVMRDLGIRRMAFRSAWDMGVLEMNVQLLKEIHHQLAWEGVEVSCVGSAVGKIALDQSTQAEKAQMESAIQAADLLGTDRIRGFTFFPGQRDRDACLNEVIDRIAALTAMAKAAGKTLLLECERDVIADNSQRLRRVLEGVNDSACLAVLDASNCLSVGENPFKESLPRLAPFLCDVHVKDSRRGGAEKVPPGQGEAKWPELIRALKDYDGLCLTLEPHLTCGGLLRGFSGEAGFRLATQALTELLEAENIECE